MSMKRGTGLLLAGSVRRADDFRDVPHLLPFVWIPTDTT